MTCYLRFGIRRRSPQGAVAVRALALLLTLRPDPLRAQSAAQDSLAAAASVGDVATARSILDAHAALGASWAYGELGVLFRRIADQSSGDVKRSYLFDAVANWIAAEALGATGFAAQRQSTQRLLTADERNLAQSRARSLLARHPATVALGPTAARPDVPSSGGRIAPAGTRGRVSNGNEMPSQGSGRRASAQVPSVKRALDALALSVTPDRDRILLARYVAAQGRKGLADLMEWLADEIEHYPSVLEFVSAQQDFDARSAGSLLVEEVDRYYDPGTQSVVIRERTFGPAGRESERAWIALRTSRLAIQLAVWALGQTGQPEAAPLIEGLAGPPLDLPRSLLRDAAAAARSGRTRSNSDSELVGARIPSDSQELNILASRNATAEDRMRIAKRFAKSTDGRSALARLLALRVAIEVSSRPPSVLDRMAMLDPERAQSHLQIERTSTEAGITICAALEASKDVRVLPVLERVLTLLKEDNPEAGLTQILARTIASIRGR